MQFYLLENSTSWASVASVLFMAASPVPSTVSGPLSALRTSFWEEEKINKGHTGEQRAGGRCTESLVPTVISFLKAVGRLPCVGGRG